MKKKNNRKQSGKYLKTIYIWSSLFFIVVQVAFSTTILLKTNQQEVESNYEMNKQIFRQVAFNVEQSDQSIRNLCLSLFVNPKITRMMHSNMQDKDIFEWITEFQSVCDPILFSNSQVQSIYVYNQETDHFFSSYRYLNFQDEELRILFETEEVPVLKPIVREIDSLGKQEKKMKVITYILYDTLDQTGKPNRAVIINIDFDKFINEIKSLITFSEEEKSTILLFDNMEYISFGQEEADEILVEEIRNMLTDQHIPAEDDFLLRTEKIMGNKYGIFLTKIPSMNWTIVKVQSYQEVYYNINRQKMIIVVVSVIFCTMMLLLTYGLARKIYSPIGQLVQKVRWNKAEEDSEENDILYLNQTYESLLQKVRENQKKGSQNKVMLNYNLRSLLISGNETDDKVLENLQAADGELFHKDNRFGVGVLHIDNYRTFQEKNDRKDQELYKYAIENILSEVLEQQGYRSVIIPLGENKMAVILHGNPKEEEDYCKEMRECFCTADANMKKYFNISFSASISSYQQGMERIPELYRRAESQLVYRYVLGKESVTLYDYKVEQADDKAIFSVMDQLNRHIQENNEKEISTDFEKITELVKHQDSDNLMEFITSLVIQILHMIGMRDRANNGYSGNVFLERYTEILALDTWEEMRERLQKNLVDVNAAEEKRSQKANLLTSTIEKIVQEEYHNPNLCVQQIAEMVKMSSQYVGRVFRGERGISVADYINEYRLKKSIEFMMATGCTVSEVLEKVGIENESQYYRLFKKRYGTTPRAHMLELLAEGLVQQDEKRV